MILWLSVAGAAVLIAAAATWMIQRSIDRLRRGRREIVRDGAVEDQLGL